MAETDKNPEITQEMVLESQAALIERLSLEEIDTDLYRGQNEPNRPGRIFGGQVAAQALMAAGQTVEEGLLAHSLHGYFLRAGDPEHPVIYAVDRIREGRSFTTRRVVAKQHGKAIFNMAASFHIQEAGIEHRMEMPHTVDPETIPTWNDRVLDLWKKASPEMQKLWLPRPRPVDMREVDLPIYLGGEPKEGPNLVWFRTPAPLSDDLFLHQCILTYATDFSLIDSMLKQHGMQGPMGSYMTASLDHAIWFHKPLRVDDWLLYVQDSPMAGGARGFARGTIFTRDGDLVASSAQEGLIRPVPPEKAGNLSG